METTLNVIISDNDIRYKVSNDNDSWDIPNVVNIDYNLIDYITFSNNNKSVKFVSEKQNERRMGYVYKCTEQYLDNYSNGESINLDFELNLKLCKYLFLDSPEYGQMEFSYHYVTDIFQLNPHSINIDGKIFHLDN